MTLTLHEAHDDASPQRVTIAGHDFDVVARSTTPREFEILRLQQETGVRNLVIYEGESSEEVRRRVEVALARTRTAGAVIATQLARPGETWDPDFAEGVAYMITRTLLAGDEPAINALLARAVHELLTGELLPWEGGRA